MAILFLTWMLLQLICQILSTKENDLWNFTSADGKSIKKGIDFLYPYIADKNKWPFAHDVMYWDDWPVAQPFLVFGANAFDNKAMAGYLETIGS
jgi:hypothetical protein